MAKSLLSWLHFHSLWLAQARPGWLSVNLKIFTLQRCGQRLGPGPGQFSRGRKRVTVTGPRQQQPVSRSPLSHFPNRDMGLELGVREKKTKKRSKVLFSCCCLWLFDIFNFCASNNECKMKEREDVLRVWPVDRSREHSSGFRNFHFHWLAARGWDRVSGTDNQDTVWRLIQTENWINKKWIVQRSAKTYAFNY